VGRRRFVGGNNEDGAALLPGEEEDVGWSRAFTGWLRPSGPGDLGQLQGDSRKRVLATKRNWDKSENGLQKNVFKFIQDLGFKNQRIQNIFKLKFELGSN
jgi:hypothetical protein